ncbi:FMN-linked oxidoreductase [Meredithblackwellia eburnea MCA 4105]
MVFFPLTSKAGGPLPVLNSACPWASSKEDIAALYNSPFTSAITTRTSTLNGFDDDASKHQMAFFGSSGESSTNSFGYSPYPLATYLAWVRPLLTSSTKPKKQVIISVTGNLDETKQMLKILQQFADDVKSTIGVEFNASCPNFRGHPPPAYVESELRDYFALLAAHASPTLKVGMKLPPYTYDGQFDFIIAALSTVSPKEGSGKTEHPITFLTSTNTLGQGLVFSKQIKEIPGATMAQGKKDDLFAVPGGFGGLAGAAVHQISLGNVYRLTTLLKTSSDKSLASIGVIGVGGVADSSGVERMRLAGASAVACASALGREGVAIFDKLTGGAKARL